MKLHFTHDWLRERIENDPDIESDIIFQCSSKVEQAADNCETVDRYHSLGPKTMRV